MIRAAVLSMCAIIVSASVVPTQARADGGRITAGVLGGLAAGTIIGAAMAPRYYYAPVYVAPEPVYVAPSCHWTWGERAWDGYRWVRSRVQVCD
jgi:hypothetical protein